MTMPCEAWQDRLPDAITAGLEPEERRALEAHAERCARCRASLDEWRALQRALSGLDAGLALPSVEDALAKVEQPSRRAAPLAIPLRWRRRAALAAGLLLALGLTSLLAGLALRPRDGFDDPLASELVDAPSPGGYGLATAVTRRSDPLPASADREGPDPAQDEAGPGLPGDPTARSAAPRPRPSDAPAPLAPLAPLDPTNVPAPVSSPEPPRPPVRPPRPTDGPAPEPSVPPPAVTDRPEPPTPAPTAVARIAGRVEDPAGRGLPWALVFLRPVPDDGRRFLLTDTAGDGSFALSLPAGRYRLVVEAEGFAPVWYGGEEPAVLELTPDSALEGLVLRLPALPATPSPAAQTPTPGSAVDPGPTPALAPSSTPLPGPGGAPAPRPPRDPEPPGPPVEPTDAPSRDASSHPRAGLSPTRDGLCGLEPWWMPRPRTTPSMPVHPSKARQPERPHRLPTPQISV